MTQATFSRGLRPQFVEQLNELYDRPESWWRTMMDTEDLLLAVRENYVNIYYRGCSLLKLEDRTGASEPVGTTHYKYLLRPEYSDRVRDVDHIFENKKEITIIDGKVNLPDAAGEFAHIFSRDLTNIDAIKKAAILYADREKACVHNFAINNPNIIDLEIAFRGETGQMDFASFQNTGHNTEIVFFEAKMISNPDLRADGCKDPKVIGQIQSYANLLRKTQKEIVESYSRVCSNFVKLRGGIRCPEVHEIPMSTQFMSVANRTGLIVNCAPRLVVFVPEDHQPDKNWKLHRDKLVNHRQLAGRVFFWSVPKLQTAVQK